MLFQKWLGIRSGDTSTVAAYPGTGPVPARRAVTLTEPLDSRGRLVGSGGVINWQERNSLLAARRRPSVAAVIGDDRNTCVWHLSCPGGEFPSSNLVQLSVAGTDGYDSPSRPA